MSSEIIVDFLVAFAHLRPPVYLCVCVRARSCIFKQTQITLSLLFFRSATCFFFLSMFHFAMHDICIPIAGSSVYFRLLHGYGIVFQLAFASALWSIDIQFITEDIWFRLSCLDDFIVYANDIFGDCFAFRYIGLCSVIRRSPFVLSGFRIFLHIFSLSFCGFVVNEPESGQKRKCYRYLCVNRWKWMNEFKASDNINKKKFKRQKMCACWIWWQWKKKNLNEDGNHPSFGSCRTQRKREQENRIKWTHSECRQK